MRRPWWVPAVWLVLLVALVWSVLYMLSQPGV
jgi:hypothetical protein